VLRENTISYSILGKYIRMFVLSTRETGTVIVPESEGDSSIDIRIALVLPKDPFHSLAELRRR
jgi:F420-0:gamma-glutamyl ligase